jgi:hypothetical protein
LFDATQFYNMPHCFDQKISSSALEQVHRSIDSSVQWWACSHGCSVIRAIGRPLVDAVTGKDADGVCIVDRPTPRVSSDSDSVRILAGRISLPPAAWAPTCPFDPQVHSLTRSAMTIDFFRSLPALFSVRAAVLAAAAADGGGFTRRVKARFRVGSGLRLARCVPLVTTAR